MICNPCAYEADVQQFAQIPLEELDKYPEIGHKACKGCDCQHKPVKEGQISAEG
jgi:hypothetical protein